MDNQTEARHRKRAKNFLKEEEMLLVNLVDDHKHIIENKKSDSVVWKQKEAVWKKIEDDLAASMGLRRPWKALRDKYEVIKRKSKIELAEQKLETYRTGGGMVTCKVSTVSKKIASMLGDSATGLENTYDSDFVVEPDYIDYSELNASNESIEASNKENNNPMNVSTEGKDWSTDFCPQTLKKPKSKELVHGGKRKRNLEEEKLELVLLQQSFYRNENIRAQEKHENEEMRAQEKHEHEISSLKLKNEILQLELEEKKLKFLE
ncbi:uncharacterized protein LOC131802975 [Musca domestica]|uniref:Regulatory protein zeste n=1 Tax=Musca domestica TaxID=7370 RepID=A0ABM3V1Y4_MUSDO|nr:uncharacterized protein LOC131802975 [Musca domestica]